MDELYCVSLTFTVGESTLLFIVLPEGGVCMIGAFELEGARFYRMPDNYSIITTGQDEEKFIRENIVPGFLRKSVVGFSVRVLSGGRLRITTEHIMDASNISVQLDNKGFSLEH